MTVAILCSGQGGQHSGMFDLFSGVPELEPLFAAASEQLGQDPRRLVQEADPAALFTDHAGQILCCIQALAAFTALDTVRPRHAVIAGYSVGELAAWGCAGSLDMPATLRLAQRRAALMDAAAPKDGGLAAVVGLHRSRLEPILQRHATYMAIVNGSGSFVIGGHNDALDACCREAIASGAHTRRLPIAVPSHTPLLADAMRAFRIALREAEPRAPHTGYRLLSGIDGDAVGDVETGCDKLAAQICTTIDWAACLESCRAAGAELALELGPGTALSRMAAPLFPEGCARSAEEFRSLAGLRAWLSSRRTL
jgi:[acyl-carrier-protein] S-malonyltransferase